MAEDAVTIERWAGLIGETRQALAALREGDLEALAERAERELRLVENARGFQSTSELPHVGGKIRSDESLRELAASHRLLGELLEATAGNLAVLRRMRDGETNSRWRR